MYLRGVIHMNQNNFDRAKEFYLKAVQVDARCYQAYDQLITNSLLDPDEGTLQPHSQPPLTIELALLNNLDFQGIPAECRDFIRLIYLTKLNKVNLSPLLLQPLTSVQTLQPLHRRRTSPHRNLQPQRKRRPPPLKSKPPLCLPPIHQMSRHNHRNPPSRSLPNRRPAKPSLLS